ncbi:MAG: hypothetical protein ACREKJ_11405 [Candidatus Rokuibacteriota bacterium]
MRWAPRAVERRASTVTGLLAVVAMVSLPVEVTVRLEHPVVAPAPIVSFLLVGSCVLLLGSGLGLRRLEAARVVTPRPTPSA